LLSNETSLDGQKVPRSLTAQVGATETAKRRRGDAAKNQLSLDGSRDVSSKILAKLREVEPQ
jgi:hypothetical protein